MTDAAAPTPLLLLRVAAVWHLPGLGLLALPAGVTPHLAPFPLHTALAVWAIGPGGGRCAATATVEEVTRPDEPMAPTRGLLLLDFNGPPELVFGTEIWLAEAEPAEAILR